MDGIKVSVLPVTYIKLFKKKTQQTCHKDKFLSY